jgi:hypothetical protein
MKTIAAIMSLATLSCCAWLAWLCRRPLEFELTQSGFVQLRFSGLAIAVSLLAAAVAWIAARRGLGAAAVAALGGVGVVTALGAARRPALPGAVEVLADAAWLASAAVVAEVTALLSPHFALLSRRRRRIFLAAVAATGVLAASLGGRSGLAATIGRHPSSTVPVIAKVALAANLVALATAGCWATRHVHKSRIRGPRSPIRDPLLVVAGLWLCVAAFERVIHLLPVNEIRDQAQQRYLAWVTVSAVNIPLVLTGALIGTIGWTIAVGPRVERLPSGTLLLPDRDPVSMLRADLSAWVGDPTLELAYADGAGRWVTPTGEAHLETARYDRATTVVTRNGHEIGVLEHDVELARAPDALHTAATMAGLAFDANQLLAMSELRLLETRELGERLLRADNVTRDEVRLQLDNGPVGVLRWCADRLDDGAPIREVVEPIQRATSDVRRLSHGLYPPELIEGGLSAAVGDRRGAPRRRLGAALEATAFRLVADDPDGWFSDRGNILRVHVRRETIRPETLDRIDVLDGIVFDKFVDLPIEEARPCQP